MVVFSPPISRLGDSLLDPELSLLAFQWRVLALADDSAVPLLERIRFLAIVTSNIDELYMIRMPELRRIGGARLQAVDEGIAELLAARARCVERCLESAADAGVRLVPWDELSAEECESLRELYLRDIQPDLVPQAVTLSAGHPLPHLPHLGLFVAVVFRAAPGARVRIAEHEVPRDVPRLLPVPGRENSVIALEEVLRANAYSLYPTSIVDGAYLFRVTRGGDLVIHDEDGDLLDAVASATARRGDNPAVRVEVERNMPEHVGALVIENLRREATGRDMELSVDSVQVVDGVLDPSGLLMLPFPKGAGMEYEPFAPRAPLLESRTMFDAMRERDLLVHHPFESFDETVVRLFREASVDPDVTSIKATLYRVGNPSPVAEALVAAARSGKKVFALVELQARFDEEANVHWAHALENAGGRVVYGLPGLKVHAKAAMFVRREAGREVRYVHVGTGNYNTRSGRQYTDLSLFSARESVVCDVGDVFEMLESASADRGLRRGALVAPSQLLPALLDRIRCEADHARAGRAASIAIKVNGLADAEVVDALYEASRAGVRIDLIVRGICTLRPGVPGQSSNIRVVSVVGRWLEHSRIYRFSNGGEPVYFIGSSDLRPRNLRRRVEVLVPVVDAIGRERLDAILAEYLHDETAWEFGSDGTYTQRGGKRGAQHSYAEVGQVD